MQHYLAAFLNMDWNTMSSSQEHCRANIIAERLKHDSFLLLLDDVQDGDLDLASIGLPMPLGHNQKVILTSKSQAVCARMGCNRANTVEMKCLGEEDAWNLFQYKTGVEITEANAEIHEFAKLMVSACGGLPGAICSVGTAVAGVTCCELHPDDWWYAYERFKANELPGCSGLVT
nr:probable disease resistance protein At1g12290 [Lolium perenne]